MRLTRIEPRSLVKFRAAVLMRAERLEVEAFEHRGKKQGKSAAVDFAGIVAQCVVIDSGAGVEELANTY